MDSDSSSDDEFATAGSITRRKLLESFYGQSQDGADPGLNSGDGPSARNSSGTTRSETENRNGPSEGPRSAGDTKNLDSPFFDVAAHTSHHVVNSSVNKLLDMDEQLTLQVRTLDSTTQNMVYENYSKFIDATDAVKSVGVNVQANEQGLERLKDGMETINEQSRLVEEDLGSLRDAVAEKIRVKRLLTRLDALLKLPETLSEQIAAGRYRTAASSFCRSTNILSKQSAGFESLQKIEAECNDQLHRMIKDLNRKILHWSGHENSFGLPGLASDDEDNNSDAKVDDEDDLSPDPPSSISEIFECAGSLALLGRGGVCGVSVVGGGLSFGVLSLAATRRFMDRLFDTHQLEVQDIGLNPTIPLSVDDGAAFEGDHSGRSQHSHKGQHLVPLAVVDSILETATLFRISFQDKNHQTPENEDDPLEVFVKETYSSFLLHVRSILLDHSLGLHGVEQIGSDDDRDGDGDELYEDVASAMSILIHAVRELASGLSLPEVGVSAQIAAEFVEQASDLAETLVRRRVDQKFCDLRLRVLSHCLVPFATRISGQAEVEIDGESHRDERPLQVVQVAVSDCLQLLDDTVKSIVSGRDVFGASGEAVDLPMLKQAIKASTGRFASWLAGTLEVLAGCEPSDSNFAFEASEVKTVDTEVSAIDGPGGVATSLANSTQDDISEMSNQYDALAEKVDNALQDLVSTLESKNDVYESVDFALKMVEMCRGCERAFVDNMMHSIDNVSGAKKGRSSGLFDDKKSVVLSEHERKTTKRFRLAQSRILILVATNQAFDAAATLCSTVCAYAKAENANFPVGPSEAACRVLEVAKQASSDCNALFGEKMSASPRPSFSSVAPASQPLLGMSSSPLKGLQLDVERMFQEKISIYPHTSVTLDFSRDAMLFVFFKVVIKAVAEQTRFCSFSADGYNHLLVDVEFLRGMVSHYVDKDYQVQGTDACSSLSLLLTEVINFVGERCDVDDCVGNDGLARTALEVLSDFMKSDPSGFSFIMD